MKNCPNCNSEIPEGYDICWKCNYDVIDGKIIPVIEKKKKDPFEKDIKCLRCNVQLKKVGTHKFHEGFEWGFFGDFGHIFSNKESFDLYACPECKKVEFFFPG